jgi:Putative peptidoglycan binding domain
LVLLLCLGVSQAQTGQPASSATNNTAHKTNTKHKKRKRTASWRTKGQQKIDAQRAQDIQEALIREHYLNGSPSGVWDDATQKAMQRYQADQGWQSTMTPDSRALIKLGLGPDHAHLLNPESAMTTGGSDPPRASQPTAPPVASPSAPVASPSAPVFSTPLPATSLPAQDSTGSEDPAKK